MQIWRNWYCEKDGDLNSYNSLFVPSRIPYRVHAIDSLPLSFTALQFVSSVKWIDERKEVRESPQAGLIIVPTSLCSGQIAGIVSEKAQENHFYTFVTSLIHTEGCAEGYGSSPDGMRNYDRVIVGHLLHPCVYSAFLLEHGCEKTLLSYFNEKLREEWKCEGSSFGQGSIQKEGGIENTVDHVDSFILLNFRP